MSPSADESRERGRKRPPVDLGSDARLYEEPRAKACASARDAVPAKSLPGAYPDARMREKRRDSEDGQLVRDRVPPGAGWPMQCRLAARHCVSDRRPGR
jgi:hypothetical protein